MFYKLCGLWYNGNKYDKLLGLLATLFGKLDKDIRKQTLEEVYGLPLTKEYAVLLKNILR